jgi:hypothetical protein
MTGNIALLLYTDKSSTVKFAAVRRRSCRNLRQNDLNRIMLASCSGMPGAWKLPCSAGGMHRMRAVCAHCRCGLKALAPYADAAPVRHRPASPDKLSGTAISGVKSTDSSYNFNYLI